MKYIDQEKMLQRDMYREQKKVWSERKHSSKKVEKAHYSQLKSNVLST